jgi:hypothetical protein
LTKLMHVLAQTDDLSDIRDRMTSNLRGELTPYTPTRAEAHGPAGAAGLKAL